MQKFGLTGYWSLNRPVNSPAEQKCPRLGGIQSISMFYPTVSSYFNNRANDAYGGIQQYNLRSTMLISAKRPVLKCAFS